MALYYNANTIGTFTLVQKSWKGQIQIRQGNALAIFLCIYKDPKPQDPKRPWVHQLMSFFVDKEHMNRCLKETSWEHLFAGKLQNIKLNLYYKEASVLLNSLTQAGYHVQCFYKKPKENIKITLKP